MTDAETRLTSALRHLAEAEPRAGFEGRLASSLHSAARRQHALPARWRSRLLVPAAAAALGAAVTGAVMVNHAHQHATPAAAPAGFSSAGAVRPAPPVAAAAGARPRSRDAAGTGRENDPQNRASVLQAGMRARTDAKTPRTERESAPTQPPR